MKQLMRVILVVCAGLVLWGLAEPRFHDVEEEVAAVPGLPAAWEGERFAQISDWQLGMWLANAATIRRIVDYLVQERPAFVLISGDFVYHPGESATEVLAEAAELVRPLIDAGLPVYGVLGNHDYGMSSREAPPDYELAAQVQEVLEEAGVRMLKNEAVPLAEPAGQRSGGEDAPPPAERLHLVGLGANWPGEDEPEAALDQVPDAAARVVMMHNPNSFMPLPTGAASVAVAGHTHGGQIRLPFTPAWSWLTYVKSDEVHADGWIEDGYGASGNRLYVNRGIGFSKIPIRINCVPEVTMFTLARAAEE